MWKSDRVYECKCQFGALLVRLVAEGKVGVVMLARPHGANILSHLYDSSPSDKPNQPF